MKSKRHFLAALALAMIVGLIPVGGFAASVANAAGTANMLVNPGFETSLDGWEAVGVDLVRDTSVQHEGAASVKVDRNTRYSGNIRQKGLSFQPGEAYYFSAWVKAASGSGTIGIYVAQSGNKWNNATYPLMASAVVGTEWTHIEGIRTFPTKATNPPSGYVYDNANLFIQHTTDDSAYKDADGNYPDYYVDDVVAEPVLPSAIDIAGADSASIPLEGNAPLSYSFSANAVNQLGTDEGMAAAQIVWSLDSAPSGIGIGSSDGRLTVTSAAEAGSVTVRAASAADPSVAAEHTVELVPSVPAAEPVAPVADNVVISGAAKPQRTLTGSYDYSDANGDPEAGTAVQWLIGGSASGSFTAIAGADGASYTVRNEDEGQFLKFAVTPRTDIAPSVGESVYSSAVEVTANAAPTAVNVQVGGVLVVGYTLTGTYDYADDDDDPESGSTYRWLSSDAPDGPFAPIAGATGTSLTLTAELEGAYLRFEVTPADAYNTGEPSIYDLDQPVGATPSSVYYVDPANGDDANDGKTEAAAFKTIQAARDHIRVFAGDMTSDITVYLKGGTYRPGYTLTEEPLHNQSGQVYDTRSIKTSTLAFDERDSGTNGYNIIYEAAPGEHPVIDGGRRIDGWTLYDADQNIYRAYGGGDLDTRQLYVNGVRAARARSDGGLANVTKTADGYTTSDTFLADWSDADQLEMVYKEHWTNPRCPVQSISAENGIATVTMQQPCWYFATNKGMTSATVPWYYENAYELLDQPGEWYLDQATGYFYYKPRAGEDMATADVVAPELEQLMEVKGSSLDTPVHNLVFSGIGFAYSTWLRPSTDSGLSDAQNNYIRETGAGSDPLALAAVTLENANHIEFSRDDFSHLGSIGLQTLDGSQDNRIVGNRFTDLSGSAVTIGEPSTDQKLTTDPRKLNRNNDVLDNYINGIGVDYRSSSAISAGYPADMAISHNEIGNIPYSGIHVGYGWASDPTSNTRNVAIEDNLIYDSMQELQDGAPIYTLGTTGGSVEQPSIVAGNYLLRDHNDGGQGAIYFDEGSDYWQVRDNVVEDAEQYVFMWAATIKNIQVDDTFTNTAQYTNNGTDTPIADTQLVPDADWPRQALDIILGAGLEAEYRDLRPSEPIGSLFIGDLPLSSGQTAPLGVYAALSATGAVLDASQANIQWTSENPETATVDGQGVVTAVGPGKAALSAVVDGQPVPVRNALYVDDVYDQLTVQAAKTQLMPQQTVQLEVYGRSQYGKPYALSDLTFVSSDPQVATVNEAGLVTAQAVGEATIQATATSDGKTMTGSVDLVVTNDIAGDLVQDDDYWYVSSGTKTVSAGSVTISTPGGLATFQGRRYGDEPMRFRIEIDDPTGSWNALSFRNLKANNGYSSPDNEDYLVIVTPTSVELHRFNEGTRTVLYGANGLLGPAVPNEGLSFGESHEVELTATNTEEGVHIVLTSNGQTVIDGVDSFPGAITTPGYLGLLTRQGAITLGEYRYSLKTAIGAANELLAAAVEGDEDGQYAPGSKDEFAAAISAAQAVYDDADASQADIDQAEADLADAQTAFEASKVTIDSSALAAALDDAAALQEQAVEGDSPGLYMPGAKAVLLAVQQEAQPLLSGTPATQAQLDQASDKLRAAAAVFRCTVVAQSAGDARSQAQEALAAYPPAAGGIGNRVDYLKQVKDDFQPYLIAVAETPSSRGEGLRHAAQLALAEAVFMAKILHSGE